MYALIKQEGGNLLSSSLLVESYASRDEAIKAMTKDYKSWLSSPMMGVEDSDIDTAGMVPHAFFIGSGGLMREWRVARIVDPDVIRRITLDEILAAYKAGIWRIGSAGDGPGTVCYFGDNWFHFGDDDAEELGPVDLIDKHGWGYVVEEVTKAIQFLEGEDEWWYFRQVIDEM